ncbi:helix-turn-helix domain-containing protein [Niastella sp. OAS944]|uniref:helix-turn-helix domain-containing protein n=1 Tax=Niastella sp. OAS944 TaxID=2664089 RepID=UPI003483F5B5|nr:AraC-like DNA-binding protein [Chitinophagaceae bacterium OAS944]
MKLSYKNFKTTGECRLIFEEPAFDWQFYGRDRKDILLTIAWNKGEAQKITIDNIEYDFPANTILSLMVNQTFHFSHSTDIVAWQFNREFYCIIDHDKEVSCVGFLFFNTQQQMFINLNPENTHKTDLLQQMFIEEFETVDNIQEDMLRMLLKRLIIIATRLAKTQYVPAQVINDPKLDIIRQFNVLVETHYKKEHSVKFYADQINRSPKTLSNLFALYNNKSPLTIIQDRIVLEAKRLLLYTDKSAKEIAYDLGFEDAAYFSNFFKKNTEFTPSDFRSNGVVS